MFKTKKTKIDPMNEDKKTKDDESGLLRSKDRLAAGGEPVHPVREQLNAVLSASKSMLFDFEKECDAIDAVLEHLGLDPERCRPQGGPLDAERVISLLRDKERDRLRASSVSPSVDSALAVGDLIHALNQWKRTTPEYAAPAWAALREACRALIASDPGASPASGAVSRPRGSAEHRECLEAVLHCFAPDEDAEFAQRTWARIREAIHVVLDELALLGADQASRALPTSIAVWRFEDAPKELQALSPHGGDEDWVAVVPPHLAQEFIGWMQLGTRFGVFDMSEHPHPTIPGAVVRIGCHS
jgi:hypothetical protein